MIDEKQFKSKIESGLLDYLITQKKKLIQNDLNTMMKSIEIRVTHWNKTKNEKHDDWNCDALCLKEKVIAISIDFIDSAIFGTIISRNKVTYSSKYTVI
jgi:hypothetical protein